jgi:DNA replication protein DnaC
MNISDLCTILKLTYVRDNYEQLITEARQTSQDPEDFLCGLLENEYQRRMENGQNRRLRKARFPIKKYLCDFDRTKYDEVFLPKFKELETLEFIDKK